MIIPSMTWGAGAACFTHDWNRALWLQLVIEDITSSKKFPCKAASITFKAPAGSHWQKEFFRNSLCDLEMPRDVCYIEMKLSEGSSYLIQKVFVRLSTPCRHFILCFRILPWDFFSSARAESTCWPDCRDYSGKRA